MTYLRFTPDEYRCLVQAGSSWQRHIRRPRQFKRLLVQELRYVSPDLAQRIADFRWAELRLVLRHFAERARAATESIPTDPLHDFELLEVMMIAEECAAAPIDVRCVRRFQQFLVNRLLESWPILAGKLACLSVKQFERLFKQVSERGRGSR